MARSRQTARRRKRGANGENGKNKRHNKRRKTDKKFWIEDCPDTKPPDDTNDGVVFDVMITRVELTDDYKQVSQASRAVESSDCKSEKVNESDDQANFIALPTPSDTKEDSNDDHSERKGASALVDSVGIQADPLVGGLTDKTSNGDAVKDSSDPTNASPEDKSEEKEKKVARPCIVVKRTPSAKGPLRKNYENEDNFKPLANGDCGDGITNPFPNDEVPDKFWSQRRRLFTRFDSGIQLDKESWYSVTPEAIADHIAAQMVSKLDKKVTILDMFCGCGGNAIAFARRDEVNCVICVDSDLEKLRKAAQNAKIYDVAPEKMVFIHSGIGNVLKCFEEGKLQNCSQSTGISLEEDCHGYKIGGTSHLPDCIDMTFMSPPWGGVDYGKVGKRNFNLGCITLKEDDCVYNGNELLKQTCAALGTGPLALFLPRNTNGHSLGHSMVRCGYQGPLVMEQNMLNGKLKTITTYIAFS